jgi:hypothetical protein
MKRILILIGLLACISMVAQAQLDTAITRNYVTALGPTVAYDSINVSTLVTPGLPHKGIARSVNYTIQNWNTSDTLNVVQISSDTTNVKKFIQLGPGVGYHTPYPIPLICLKIRGTAAGVVYSLVIQ